MNCLTPALHLRQVLVPQSETRILVLVLLAKIFPLLPGRLRGRPPRLYVVVEIFSGLGMVVTSVLLFDPVDDLYSVRLEEMTDDICGWICEVEEPVMFQSRRENVVEEDCGLNGKFGRERVWQISSPSVLCNISKQRGRPVDLLSSKTGISHVGDNVVPRAVRMPKGPWVAVPGLVATDDGAFGGDGNSGNEVLERDRNAFDFLQPGNDGSAVEVRDAGNEGIAAQVNRKTLLSELLASASDARPLISHLDGVVFDYRQVEDFVAYRSWHALEMGPLVLADFLACTPCGRSVPGLRTVIFAGGSHATCIHGKVAWRYI